MKLAIIGSRTFRDYDLLRRAIDTHFSDFCQGGMDGYYEPHFDEVVSGGAVGADQLAERWVHDYNKEMGEECKESWIKMTIFKPDWDKHGKSAGFIRNEDIIKACDECLCVWDGLSRGTANSLAIAKRLKKPTLIIYF